MSSCEKGGSSLSLPDCSIDFGAITAVFFTQNNAVFTTAEMADLVTSVRDKSDKGHIIPLSGVKVRTPADEEPNVQTYPGSTRSVQIAPGSIKQELGFSTNLCIAQAFISWNNKESRCFLLDHLGNFWGRRNADGHLAGFNVSTMTTSQLFQDYNEDKLAKMTINFGSPESFLPSMYSVKTELQPDDILGLRPLKIEKIAPNSFALVPSCGRNVDSFYSLFSSDAADPMIWTAVDLATNTEIAISTITPVPATESFTLTFSTPPTAGTRIALSIDLSMASGIVGFVVSDSLTYTV